MKRVLAIILGGGAGTRLQPLTKMRAKPAVPLAGKYRLIDIPISNCINSSINKMYVLTQFNSASLNRHLSQTYNLNAGFGQGFVEVLGLITKSAKWERSIGACSTQMQHSDPRNRTSPNANRRTKGYEPTFSAVYM